MGDPREYSEQLLKDLSYGYGLDGGGYEFENPLYEGLKRVSAVVWDGPDPDYVPWVRDVPKDWYAMTCPLYAFIPQEGYGFVREWPETIGEEDPDSYQYRLVGHGTVQETDRDCDCHGEWVVDPDDPWKSTWECKGYNNDNPHPKCPRCGGEGYVKSSAGQWAVYELIEEESA